MLKLALIKHKKDLYLLLNWLDLKKIYEAKPDPS